MTDDFEPIKALGWFEYTKGSPTKISKVQHSIPEETFAFCAQAIKLSAFIRSCTTDFMAVRGDYSYSERLESDAVTVACGPENPVELDHIAMTMVYSEIQRVITNFLSTASAFRDRTEARVSRRYGSESEQFKALKKNITKEYDDRFSYRLLYNLRNYAQHHDVPMSDLKFRHTTNGNGIDTKVDVRIRIDDLASSSRIQKSLIKEISQLEKKSVDFIPQMSMFMQSHCRIYLGLVEASIVELEKLLDKIMNFYELELPAGANPGIVHITKNKTSGDISIDFEHIPLREYEFLKHIAQEAADFQLRDFGQELLSR